MRTLNSENILEKNKLGSSGAWVILLEVQFESATVYVCNNDENIVWPSSGGETWIAFPFTVEDKMDYSSGEIPALTIKISNVNRLMQSYAELEDGAIGTTVIARLVNTAHLDLATAEIEESFTLVGVDTDQHYLYASLGLINPMSMEFPRKKYLKNFCRWTFKSTQCGYSGGLTTCNHTLTHCQVRGREASFGGFPGVSFGGIYK